MLCWLGGVSIAGGTLNSQLDSDKNAESYCALCNWFMPGFAGIQACMGLLYEERSFTLLLFYGVLLRPVAPCAVTLRSMVCVQCRPLASPMHHTCILRLLLLL